MAHPPLPPDFLSRMATQLPEQDLAALESALNGTPSVSVRLNPYRQGGDAVGGTPIPWCSLGRQLPARPVFTLDPLFHAGNYYVQEAASMFLHHVLQQLPKPEQGFRALDLCAAPGGKTTLLASWMGNQGLLVANEVIPDRAGILVENTIRFGYERVVVTQNDPADFGRLENWFDLMLVDAPCSGEGLFRKDHRARELWSAQNVDHCSLRQRRILAEAVAALRPGGTLLYSTCTWAPLENEAQLDWLVNEFGLEPVPVKVPEGWGIDQGPTGATFRFYPHQTRGEGFFLAVLQKTGEANPTKEQKRKKKTGNNRLSPKERAALHTWFKEGVAVEFLPHPDGSLVAVPEELASTVKTLLNLLKVRYTGVNMGKWNGRQLVPAHPLVMNRLVNPALPALHLSKADALRFLAREPLAKQPEWSPGWNQVLHGNNPLGWAKVLPNRINNYLPASWRIRMDINSAIDE